MRVTRLWGTWLLWLAALFILATPGVGQAFSYQNNEYSFKIECPQAPREVAPVSDVRDKGVALNFSADDKTVYAWLIQVRQEDFVDPGKLSEQEVQTMLAELKRADYGKGQICDSAEVVEVGKYQGVLLLMHDSENYLAISMVGTEKGTYLLTLVGSTSDREAFKRNLGVYRLALSSFTVL